MTLAEWEAKHPIGSYLEIKYDNRTSRTQIIEYEIINDRLFMHAGIHTISLNPDCNNMGMYRDEDGTYKEFPVLSV